MDSFQVAILTLAALAVGILIPIVIQLWLALRQVQQEVHNAAAIIGPVVDDVRGLTRQLRNNSQVTSAVAVAVTAGVQAWLKTRQSEPADSPQPENTP